MSFDYTKYSYDDLVSLVTEFVQNQDEWQDAYASSTGQILIQLLSAVTSQLHYMLERRTQESFLETAKLESSVNALAALLGYVPRLSISSFGTLELNLVDADGVAISPQGNIKLEKYKPITFENIDLLVRDEVNITNSTIFPVQVPVIQGTVKELTIDTTDTTGTFFNQGYVLIPDFSTLAKDSFIISTSTQTFINVEDRDGTDASVSSLSFATPTDRVYELRVATDGMRIIFGDGVYGEKPTGTITIQYVDTNGVETNIQALGGTFQFSTDTLGDDIPVTPANAYSYTLTNTTTITGGRQKESVAEIKQNAPAFVRTSNRAVTKDDYVYWVKQSAVANIVDAQCYGQEEIGIDPVLMNNVYIPYLKADGTTLTSQEQIDLRAFMDVYKTITTHLVFEPVDILNIQLQLQGKRSTGVSASNSQIFDFVREFLVSTFQFGEGSLGKSILHSEIVQSLHNLKFQENGIQKSVFDYVIVDMLGVYDISSNRTSQLFETTLSYGVDGDVYTAVVNDNVYSYTTVSGDNAKKVATELAASIDAGEADVAATATNETLQLQSAAGGTSFTIANNGTTVPTNFPIIMTYTLPSSVLNNENSVQQVLPDSVEILDSNFNVLFTDDALGNIAGGTINYVTGILSVPTLAGVTEVYKVRYQQPSGENFEISPRQAVGIIPPKGKFTDTVETPTTIEFIA